MSKMDNLRAMREARFERTSSAQPRPPAPDRPMVTPVAEALPAEVEMPAAEGLCGHRNIGGRTCTRERGHAAKSHRYS